MSSGCSSCIELQIGNFREGEYIMAGRFENEQELCTVLFKKLKKIKKQEKEIKCSNFIGPKSVSSGWYKYLRSIGNQARTLGPSLVKDLTVV
ncbi:hypothetical protein BB560_001322 [Smittium megazygosporum]|uniref:Uncharacterized protein n=1 Tax=Smittium megazygosporum TaxID=133381 RepID=A0A2T9ZI55_9FUNG|nr:hypothetical protein BB560_001322 [Smittium megazygosporum]